MSNTIEAVIGRTLPMQRSATSTQAKRLTAAWQNGFESNGHVQRKLRLGFVNALTQRPAN